MRFSIRTLLLTFLILGVLFWAIAPPRVEFLNSTARVLQTRDGTVSVFKMEVVNSGVLPIWCRIEPTQTTALGVTKNVESGNRYESDAKWAPWTMLTTGESVWIEEIHYGQHCIAGIPVRDWTGRKHLIFNRNIDYVD